MKSPSRFGTEAERVQWTQLARRSVGNGKERLRDYAGFPDRQPNAPMREAQKKQESQRDRSLPRPVGETGRRSVGNRKERLRDYASSPGAEGDNYDSDTLR